MWTTGEMGQLKLSLDLCSEKGKEGGLLSMMEEGQEQRSEVSDWTSLAFGVSAYVSVCAAQIRHRFFICSLMSTCTNSTLLLLKR